MGLQEVMLARMKQRHGLSRPHAGSFARREQLPALPGTIRDAYALKQQRLRAGLGAAVLQAAAAAAAAPRRGRRARGHDPQTAAGVDVARARGRAAARGGARGAGAAAARRAASRAGARRRDEPRLEPARRLKPVVEPARRASGT